VYGGIRLTVVELDGKGRILIPAETRKAIKSRRFELRVEEGHIELLPMPDPRHLKGKYKNCIDSSWEELEEKAERFVAAGKR